MTINITPEVIITSYIITSISHALLWATWRFIKLARKGISDERKAYIRYHARNHGGKLAGCEACVTTTRSVMSRPPAGYSQGTY